MCIVLLSVPVQPLGCLSVCVGFVTVDRMTKVRGLKATSRSALRGWRSTVTDLSATSHIVTRISLLRSTARSTTMRSWLGRTACGRRRDTHVIAPMLEVGGPRAIDELDGFYSGVVVRTASRKALCLRDHMGKKPLFVGRSSTEVFITSEVKVFEEVDWFEPLPLGVAKVDLDTGEVTRVASHRLVTPERDLASSFQRAVRKRMPHPISPWAFLERWNRQLARRRLRVAHPQ